MNTRLGKARWCTYVIAVAAALVTATSAGAGSAITLNAAVGNYIIKPNGRVVVDPKLPPRRSAKHWLAISPKSFTVKANGKFDLKVRSHPGRKAGAGDHHALVLFTTKPSAKGKVLVRTRIGVGVLVRVKGKIKRRLAIAGLSATRRTHKLRLVIANRGNINERLLRHRVSVTLRQGKRTVQKLWAPPRQILPHSRTVYALPYRPGLKGNLTAIVTVR